jgi:hypothetical protein
VSRAQLTSPGGSRGGMKHVIHITCVAYPLIAMASVERNSYNTTLNKIDMSISMVLKRFQGSGIGMFRSRATFCHLHSRAQCLSTAPKLSKAQGQLHCPSPELSVETNFLLQIRSRPSLNKSKTSALPRILFQTKTTNATQFHTRPQPSPRRTLSCASDWNKCLGKEGLLGLNTKMERPTP